MARPRVGLLMSVLCADAHSRRGISAAVGSLSAQPNVDIRLYVRLVGGPELTVPIGDVEAMSIQRVGRRETMPETLGALWEAAREECDYCGVFNADDTWLPGGVTALASALTAAPAATVSYGDFRLLNEVTGTSSAGNVMPPTTGPLDSPVPNAFALFRVEAARQLEDRGEPVFDWRFPRVFDWALWVRLRTLGSYVLAPGVVGTFLYRSSSVSHSDPDAFRAEQQRLRDWGAAYWRDHAAARANA